MFSKSFTKKMIQFQKAFLFITIAVALPFSANNWANNWDTDNEYSKFIKAEYSDSNDRIAYFQPSNAMSSSSRVVPKTNARRTSSSTAPPRQKLSSSADQHSSQGGQQNPTGKMEASQASRFQPSNAISSSSRVVPKTNARRTSSSDSQHSHQGVDRKMEANKASQASRGKEPSHARDVGPKRSSKSASDRKEASPTQGARPKNQMGVSISGHHPLPNGVIPRENIHFDYHTGYQHGQEMHPGHYDSLVRDSLEKGKYNKKLSKNWQGKIL